MRGPPVGGGPPSDFAAMLSNALVWGPQPVSEAIERIDALLADATRRRTRTSGTSGPAPRCSRMRVTGPARRRLAGGPATPRGDRPAGVHRGLPPLRRRAVPRRLRGVPGCRDPDLRTVRGQGETGARSTITCFAAQASLELRRPGPGVRARGAGTRAGRRGRRRDPGAVACRPGGRPRAAGRPRGGRRAQPRGGRPLGRVRRDEHRRRLGREGGVPRARGSARRGGRGGPSGLRLLGREGVRQRDALGGALDDAVLGGPRAESNGRRVAPPAACRAGSGQVPEPAGWGVGAVGSPRWRRFHGVPRIGSSQRSTP